VNETQVRALVQDELRRLLAPLAPATTAVKPTPVRGVRDAAAALGMGKTAFKGLVAELTEGTHYWQSNSKDARVPRYEFDVEAIREYVRGR
jgi:hypothetical protein